MRQRSRYAVCMLACALLFMGVTVAQHPEKAIDPVRQPDLAAAEHHITEAIEKTEAAQRANKDKLGGHAQKALELLAQARRELKEAAEYAEHEHK